MMLTSTMLTTDCATRKIRQYRLIEELTAKANCFEANHQIPDNSNGRHTFLAQDEATQEYVVLKLFLIEKAIHVADQWIELKLFGREAQVLEKLNHPAIPQYKEAFETDIEGIRSFVLVQKYIEADSLETLIRSGKRFCIEEVVAIAHQLLSVLSYLHQQAPPIIHRDIKPSNILIKVSKEAANKPSIYLVDFGSVHTDLTKESGTITIVGSYGYIPLEQFSGQAAPTSDLYSLGMTLIYLITGIHPADLKRVDSKVQLAHLPVPLSLAQWLEKMTALYPNQRFDSAKQASIALKRSGSQQSGRYDSLKPEGTKIELARSQDSLYITFNPIPSVPWPIVALLTIISFWMLFSTSSMHFLYAAPISFFLFRPALVVIGRIFLRDYFPLQRQTVVEAHKLLGLRHASYWTFRPQRRQQKKRNTKAPQKLQWQSICPLQDLDLLAYNPGYKFDSYTKGKYTIKQSNFKGVPPQLSVHSGELAHTIGHERFTPAEFWWLGQELSDFLELELQTIYPMPIVTMTDNTASGGCGC